MDLIRHDLLLATRSLARRPGLTAAALLTVSLGVGAVASIFSVLYGVVIRPLPYFQPEQLVRVSSVGTTGESAPWSGATYTDFEQQSSVYQTIAGFQYADYSMRADDFPIKVTGATVTADFFEVFGVQPIEGRTFFATDTSDRSEQAIVLGYGFWQTQFAGKPVLGMKIDINDRSAQVVGVMPPDFDYPTGAEIWVASRYRVPSRLAAPRTTQPPTVPAVTFTPSHG